MSSLGSFACGPPPCPAPCPPVCPPPCPAPCPPPAPVCAVPRAAMTEMGSGAMCGAVVLGFIVIWLFFWVLFFSFNPWFVKKVEKGEDKPCDSAPPCPARVFVSSLVAALIVSIIIWVVRACATKSC